MRKGSGNSGNAFVYSGFEMGRPREERTSVAVWEEVRRMRGMPSIRSQLCALSSLTTILIYHDRRTMLVRIGLLCRVLDRRKACRQRCMLVLAVCQYQCCLLIWVHLPPVHSPATSRSATVDPSQSFMSRLGQARMYALTPGITSSSLSLPNCRDGSFVINSFAPPTMIVDSGAGSWWK